MDELPFTRTSICLTVDNGLLVLSMKFNLSSIICVAAENHRAILPVKGKQIDVDFTVRLVDRWWKPFTVTVVFKYDVCWKSGVVLTVVVVVKHDVWSPNSKTRYTRLFQPFVIVRIPLESIIFPACSDINRSRNFFSLFHHGDHLLKCHVKFDFDDL